MPDISTYMNPDNGDYVLQNGAILNNNSLLAEMYFCLNTPLGSWIYDKTLGNQLLNLKVAPPASQAAQLVGNALSRLVSRGRIKNVQIKVLVPQFAAYSVQINAFDATGKEIGFIWRKP